MEKKRKKKILENKSQKKINKILKNKWNKNKTRDKQKFETSLNRPKGQKPIFKMKINNSSPMHRSALRSGKETGKAFTLL